MYSLVKSVSHVFAVPCGIEQVGTAHLEEGTVHVDPM